MNNAESKNEVEKFMAGLKQRNPGMPEFQQAAEEFVDSVMPFVIENKEYRDANILERITEPDRVITFRVTWQDDDGNYRVNRGWRVQFNNSIGPYKGGLRFHPTVDLSVLKFLGFEQIFKNSLTGLPMGGGKGGSNFDPKGKSDHEVMRFCQSFMTELARHIDEDTDVPAGDIGVGAREIGYLFGQWKRLTARFTGSMTGKGLDYGGSLIRKEATGYGTVYFVRNMLNAAGNPIEGKTFAISGSGNVAIYATEKVNQLGGKVVTLSDSSGTIYDEAGIYGEKLDFVRDLKEVRRGRIQEYAEKFGCKYLEAARPWGVPCDVALPCATQNELELEDAKALIKNGVQAVAEGANMPSSLEALRAFHDAGVLFGPGKAANAGGVAVSGLEQSQNAQRLSWKAEDVDSRLEHIMEEIHGKCCKWGGQVEGKINYVRGANLGGFSKVANAMLAYGVT